MPDDHDTGIHKVIPEKGDSPKRRREKIIVLGTIALVILTVILVARRNSASGSDGTQNVDGFDGVPGGSGGGSNDGSGSGFAGGGGAIGDPTINGIGSEIGAIGAQQTADEGTLANLTQRANNLSARIVNKNARINRLREKTMHQGKLLRQERKDIRTLRFQVRQLQHHPTHGGKKGQHHAGGHHAVHHPTVHRATHRSR